MNLNLPIPTQTIQQIRQLSQGHPVYLVSVPNDNFVVKMENTTSGKNLRQPLEIMNVIDPSAFTRVLNKEELMGLRNWLQSHANDVEEFTPGYMLDKLKGALKPPMPTPNGIMHMQENVWIVMHAQKNLRDIDGAWNKRLQGDKSGVKEIAAILNKPGSLEKLGEIIAADAFNNNNDRINLESIINPHKDNHGKILETSEGKIVLKCIQNPGNFFFGERGSTSVVLGLDSFDPNNLFRNFDVFLTTNDGFYYAGVILHENSGAQRKLLCENVVSDIETLLGPRNRKIIFASKKRLPSDAASKISAGIRSGATKIFNHIKLKYKGKPISPAFQQRLNVLGWDLNT
ncbi:MAG: hypothetical protein JNL32_01080 [Candidatus Kapabacteria bacterium]|nr:hypothetical protein [Candidatus Kapabacteria bacterium]